jgi:Transcriptional regulator, AbiEi antitoxin
VRCGGPDGGEPGAGRVSSGMRKKIVQPSTGRRITALAERQHGVVTRVQLVEFGVTDQSIDRRVKDGRLWRVHRGVYAVGRPTLTMKGRFMAAVLSCGPGAALSHIAAGVRKACCPSVARASTSPCPAAGNGDAGAP